MNMKFHLGVGQLSYEIAPNCVTPISVAMTSTQVTDFLDKRSPAVTIGEQPVRKLHIEPGPAECLVRA